MTSKRSSRPEDLVGRIFKVAHVDDVYTIFKVDDIHLESLDLYHVTRLVPTRGKEIYCINNYFIHNKDVSDITDEWNIKEEIKEVMEG